MKRFFWLVLLSAMLVVGPTWAAEDVSFDNSGAVRYEKLPDVFYKLVIDIQVAADGSLTNTQLDDEDILSAIRGRYIEYAKVIPGDTTQCDTTTDILFTEVPANADNDDLAEDLMGGELYDVSATAVGRYLPKSTSGYGKVQISNGDLYIDVVGNTTADCTLTVQFYLRRQ